MKQPDNDWRMDDFVTLAKDWRSPWSGQLVPKGSQITKVSVAQLTKKKMVRITLPNATALFLSASRRSWESARSIREHSKIDRSIKSEVAFDTTSDSFDYLEQVMESIVMAFTALEAFVNELIDENNLIGTINSTVTWVTGEHTVTSYEDSLPPDLMGPPDELPNEWVVQEEPETFEYFKYFFSGSFR